jgi:hypothetical protein
MKDQSRIEPFETQFRKALQDARDAQIVMRGT